MTKIDWAMLTSANLSTQAWGAATNAAGDVRVCSYEIGVVVWPALWGPSTEMVPVFKKDTPDGMQGSDDRSDEWDLVRQIGLRMPYDLPLVPYSPGEMPWSAELAESKPDLMGRSWPGYRTD